jgi:hypothetical protein
MNDVATRYQQAGLPRLAQLYEYAVATGLRDTGSSSINPRLTDTVEEVKQVMLRRAGVRPSNQTTAGLWAALGDPSATFYFSGFRKDDRMREKRICRHC